MKSLNEGYFLPSVLKILNYSTIYKHMSKKLFENMTRMNWSFKRLTKVLFKAFVQTESFVSHCVFSRSAFGIDYLI